MKYKLYECGGHVRDGILGIESKDIDYSVVIENREYYTDTEDAYDAFVADIKEKGYEVFLETKDCLTVRAKFPDDHIHSGIADFVLSRREVGYIPNTRTPIVELGTLEDDLLRRDFTVNALARDLDGNIIDLFDGITDLRWKLLDTPSDPVISMRDDPLRIIRALRFCVTKDLTLSSRLVYAIRGMGIAGLSVVSEERIREELHKCFKYNSKLTLEWLNYFEDTCKYPILSYIFDNTDLWLLPTTKS